ncbi:hypothetical protein BV924_20655 [Pectobacterium odoriferum]|uniref:CD-NTase-associated protein 15 domain-containing protein n=1 Tax=Pectobacterium odoriferum TaxID=78398 RepID=A0ABD6VLF3_9GAMM|nr:MULTISPECIES: hypothetical protein [Pectobacterium]KHT28569.1 hypothetical protein RC98_08735 [Pectobacterium carotovorum subsp. carotovorum]POE08683.1 hypothetical protein BV924_20655 [Pectobacterium odoriferum]POE23282.1 hypothetical protein BV926_20935 [Pectobacterium odoriferum]POE27944.1 hypothetical protein BV919_20585 [Pectobacterium odoriferum]
MKSHEYIVICGLNRSQVGRLLAIVASILSAFIIFSMLKVAEMLKHFNFDSHIPPSLLSLGGAGTIYLVLYKLLDKSLWRAPLVGRALRVPNLSGKWQVHGLTKTEGGGPWEGVLTIVQSWDKVRIVLKTAQSQSDSVTASIIYDECIGYQLLYHYKNQPKMGEEHLHAHIGFAEFWFDENLLTAEGHYFNAQGRATYGTMTIERIAHV